MLAALLLALDLTTFQGHERVLEVGCGDGNFAAQLAHEVPDGLVLGIDANPERIAFAERTYDPDLFANLQFKFCAPSDLDETSQFEVIILHDMPTQKTARSLVEALRSDGRLLVTQSAQSMCIYAALDELTHSDAWREWLSAYQPPAPYDPQPALETGLLLIQTETQEGERHFQNRHAVAEWLMEWLPVAVPDYRRAALVEAVIDQLLLSNPELHDASGFRIPHTAWFTELKKIAL